ncbi:MAG: hypothetical protein GC178_16545 [Flavobacteriales bacterium]|nr:hypothetical protein [Flavobacteriales bacterium]
MGLEPGFRYTFRSERAETDTISVEFVRVPDSDLSEYRLTVIEYKAADLPPRLRKQIDTLKKVPFVGNIGMVQNGLWSIMHDFDECGWKMYTESLEVE